MSVNRVDSGDLAVALAIWTDAKYRLPVCALAERELEHSHTFCYMLVLQSPDEGVRRRAARRLVLLHTHTNQHSASVS